MDEKICTEQRTQSAPPPAKARVTTTLDSLPAGSAGAAQQKINTKQPLPEGVTSRMLYKDFLRIGWPSFVELMLTQLTSMADTMMVGRLGAWALSAVGLTMQPKMLLATAFMALNTGTMALVGRYRGAGNQKKRPTRVEAHRDTFLFAC